MGIKKLIKCLLGGGYIINESKSYCEVNGSKDTEVRLYTNAAGEHVFANLQKNSKCWLYFYIRPKTMDEILASYNIGSRGSFSSVYTTATTKTIFTASDGLGTSKYFAGAPTDNYVKFGGFYWRIIRMNGDKSTRLIYAGKASVIDGLSNKQEVLANGYDDSGTKYTQIKTSAFNTSNNDNAYVGFKYAKGSLRGIANKSTILGELDTWYEANLKTDYGKYIDGSTGFCGDRAPSTSNTTSNGSGGTGTTYTYYGDYIRLVTNQNPVLTCANAIDLYTTSGSSRGNKALVNPIGLINANELVMAGAKNKTANQNYYLFTKNEYWTISPAAFSDMGFDYSVLVGVDCSFLFEVDSTGTLKSATSNNSHGVRPVINLAANTGFTGSGTWNDPFIVAES